LDRKRFEEAIKKARKKNNSLSELANEDLLIVRSNLKEIKLHITEIKWVEALGDYVKIVTKSKNIIVISTLRAFNEKLPQNKFLRIHKSYIVNLEMVDFYSHKSIEIDGYEIPRSRARKLELDKILNLIA
jgi:DNA-binding LytR/AlgR family response regulator